MVAKAKIAVSLSREVLDLVDRHAGGRSRSKCIEQELLRALRAREWERLSAKSSPADTQEELAWAESAFAAAHDELARDERPVRRSRGRRKRAR
jgi:hypothetical protein